MDVFEMVVAIVAISVIGGIVRAALISKTRGSKLKEQLSDVAMQLEERMADRIARMERRMENIETIVLEQEKHRQFDRSL